MVKRDAVAVFGSSEPTAGDPLWDLGRRTGRALAEAGFDVVTGGYGGVMEAASLGAREGGAGAFGVLCAWFDARRSNPHLTGSVVEPDLFARTRTLIDRSCAFVVLDGKAGTLAELAFLWALDRAGRLGDRPVILLGDAWSAMVDLLARQGRLDPPQVAITLRANDPDEAVRILVRRRG